MLTNNGNNIAGNIENKNIDFIKNKISIFLEYFLRTSKKNSSEKTKKIIIEKIFEQIFNNHSIEDEDIFISTKKFLVSLEGINFNSIEVVDYTSYLLSLNKNPTVNTTIQESSEKTNKIMSGSKSKEEETTEELLDKEVVSEVIDSIFDFLYTHHDEIAIDQKEKNLIIRKIEHDIGENIDKIDSYLIFLYTKKYLKVKYQLPIENTFRDFEIYRLEKNIEKNEREEQERSINMAKARKRADELYEALRPIERKLENIEFFTRNLEEIRQIKLYNKEIQISKFILVCKKNKKKIEEIFKKLKRDKDNLAYLEEDERIIRRLEREIVEAAKITFELFMRHIHRLNRQDKDDSKNFLFEEYKEFSLQLKEEDDKKCIKTAERLEIFREKLFLKLLKKGILKKKPEREKNYGLNRKNR